MTDQRGLFPEPPAALIKASRAPVPSAFPDWLKRQMEAAGLMDADTGATRRARMRFCPMCKQPVYRGIDEDWGGFSSDADPVPLSGAGEVFAKMAGRVTFELIWLGDRYELTRRTPSRIRGRPVGYAGIDVLIGHICGGGQFPSQGTGINHPGGVSTPLPDKAPF